MALPEPRSILLAQGAYYVATGIAPFVSRRLFERINGPKLEWWLVETVGGLVTVIGGVLVSAAVHDRETPEAIGLAAGSAAALGAIEVVYVLRGRIAPVYLADTVVQAAVLAGLAARSRPPASAGGRGETGGPEPAPRFRSAG